MCKIHSEIPYTDSYSIAHFYGSERETEGLCSVISNPLQPFGQVAHHASLSIRFLKQEYRSRLPTSFLKGSFWLRNQNHIFCGSCIAGRFFNHWAIRVNPYSFVNKACPQRVLRRAINIRILCMTNYTSIDFKLSFLLIIKAVPLEYCHFSWWCWHRKYELL